MARREDAISKATNAAVHLAGFQHFAYKTEPLKDGYWSDTDTELDASQDLPDDETMKANLETDTQTAKEREEARLKKKMLTLKEKEEAVYGIKKRIENLKFIRPPLVHTAEPELRYEDDPKYVPEYKQALAKYPGLKELIGPPKVKKKDAFHYPHRNDEFIEHTLVCQKLMKSFAD